MMIKLWVSFFSLLSWSTLQVSAVSKMRIVAPLQALTIYDPEQPVNYTKRGEFLPKYEAGLKAEAAVHEQYAKRRQRLTLPSSNQPGWARRAQKMERDLVREENKAAEAAFDQATREFEREHKKVTANPQPNSNNFQFVGVVQNSKARSEAPVTWYARTKPADAKWSVRLVHANKKAIVKSLFGKGKVDVFGSYRNTGQVDEETGKPIVKSDYSVRERSWRNAWNFSPKHFFTDSSGMYWRERRVRSGLYTDGQHVYEPTYRYRDGRNGLHKRSTLGALLKSSAIPKKDKDRILKRLKEDSPDIVLVEEE